MWLDDMEEELETMRIRNWRRMDTDEWRQEVKEKVLHGL